MPSQQFDMRQVPVAYFSLIILLCIDQQKPEWKLNLEIFCHFNFFQIFFFFMPDDINSEIKSCWFRNEICDVIYTQTRKLKNLQSKILSFTSNLHNSQNAIWHFFKRRAQNAKCKFNSNWCYFIYLFCDNLSHSGCSNARVNITENECLKGKGIF